jgi:diguanylate cyclase (GGDEF)-like protein
MRPGRLVVCAAVLAFAVAGHAADAPLHGALLREAGAGVAFGATLFFSLGRAGRRGGWFLLTGGLGAWWTGDIVFDVHLVRSGSLPSASIADACYLAGYVLMAAGVLVLVRERRVQGSRDGLLDGAALAGAALLVAWRFLVVPALDDGAPLLDRVVLAAYPIGDVLLLAVVAWVALVPGLRERSLALLAAFLLATLSLDVAYSLATRGEAAEILRALDALYVASYALLALAASFRDAPFRRPRTDRLHPARIVFLAAALLVIPASSLTHGGGHDFAVVALTGSGLTTCAVIARFTLAVRERERAREAIVHLATHDALTGLANRRLFLERLDAPGEDSDVARSVLFIDLDGLKLVNDRFGHDAGDAVLVDVARRLVRLAPESATVARLGGDEFAIICAGDGHPEGAQALATRVLVDLRHDPPRSPRGETFAVTASVGVVTASAGAASATELVRRADEAMYEAKRAGGDRHAVRSLDAAVRPATSR